MFMSSPSFLPRLTPSFFAGYRRMKRGGRPSSKPPKASDRTGMLRFSLQEDGIDVTQGKRKAFYSALKARPKDLGETLSTGTSSTTNSQRSITKTHSLHILDFKPQSKSGNKFILFFKFDYIDILITKYSCHLK